MAIVHSMRRDCGWRSSRDKPAVSCVARGVVGGFMQQAVTWIVTLLILLSQTTSAAAPQMRVIREP